MPLTRIIDDNIATLRQAEALCRSLAGNPIEFVRGVGPHLRHVLDHYQCFVQGLEAGLIDYDARGRDATLEAHLAQCLQTLSQMISRLQALKTMPLSGQVQIRMTTAADAPPLQSWSSPLRELQFLQSHTVHHFALIREHLQGAGHTPPADFGKAPSTLAYERASA